MNTCTPRPIVAPSRPQFTHHALTGETKVEMPVVFADRTASVTFWLDGDPGRRPVEVADLALDDDMPTSCVAGLLYAVLGDVWGLQMAANDRGDTCSACQWSNLYEAVFGYRSAWLAGLCDDLAPAATVRRPEAGQETPASNEPQAHFAAFEQRPGRRQEVSPAQSRGHEVGLALLPVV